jgi:lysophospholipase
MEGWFVRGKDRLFYRQWAKDGDKAAVVAVHRLGYHSGCFAELGEYLQEKDISLYSMDLRGFGKWEKEKGHIEKFRIYIEDLMAFITWLKKETGLRIFLLGESFGGLVSLFGGPKLQEELEGLILLSPVVISRVEVPLTKKLQMKLAAALLPSRMLPLSLIFSEKRLTNDDEAYQQVIEDPYLVKAVSARFFNEMVKAVALVPERAAKINIPTLILQAGDDEVLDKGGAELLYHALATADKELRMLDGFSHILLLDRRRHEVFEMVGEWIGDRCKG